MCVCIASAGTAGMHTHTQTTALIIIWEFNRAQKKNNDMQNIIFLAIVHVRYYYAFLCTTKMAYLLMYILLAFQTTCNYSCLFAVAVKALALFIN